MKKNKKKIFGLIGAIFTVLFLSGFVFTSTYVQIFCSNDLIYEKKVEKNDHLEIMYEHSLYKVKQKERFIINKNKFILNEMVFGNYLALDYYDHNSKGKYFKDSKGNYHLIGMNYSMEKIEFMNANFSDHIVKLADETINLGKKASKGKIIVITIENKPIFLHFIKGR
ncbi:hypothetical protein HNQ94_003061 [Salirhabdus euzebyi]|uniref:DUF1850 domain-containing protein n=1 Tax=Salirhabdus euzebyi TaxID=394506 RepID=A0A841Q8G5_9BACI|nr:DUF1850 domain-containing protein [Salirhabdus euzebyi]MBB6454572.1 hypothetical protein [Salirhabdus euzebyi]